LSIHVLSGHGAAAVAETGQHLSTRRRRVYPSDTTDVEWRLLAPLVPARNTARWAMPPVGDGEDVHRVRLPSAVVSQAWASNAGCPVGVDGEISPKPVSEDQDHMIVLRQELQLV
jgi:hypothetical protein